MWNLIKDWYKLFKRFYFKISINIKDNYIIILHKSKCNLYIIKKYILY